MAFNLTVYLMNLFWFFCLVCPKKESSIILSWYEQKQIQKENEIEGGWEVGQSNTGDEMSVKR